GLGLGLYIVKQICAAHGGDVTCISSVGRGTTFSMTLPLSAPARASEATVLVVDDHVDTRATMADALEARGYRVMTAADGALALEQMRRGKRPVAVLVDMNMPVMDGATLLELCKEDPKLRPIPLLLISSDHAKGAEVARRGAAAFLQKPLRIESLLE